MSHEWVNGPWQIHTEVNQTPPPGVTTIRQVHGDAIVTASEALDGATADGLFVAAGDGPVAIVTGDCMPLVLLAKDKAVALHVSRKTLLTNQVTNALRMLEPTELTGIWIGPHICVDHFVFEYEGDSIAAFKARYPDAVITSSDGTHLSLQAAVETVLTTRGGAADCQRYEATNCTWDDNSLPSHKAQSGQLTDVIFTVVEST